MRGQSSGSMTSLLVQAAARWATVPEVSSIWSIHSVARARHDDLWGQHASSVLEDRFVRLVWRILHPRISDCRRMVGDDGEGSGYIDGRRSITLPPSERLVSISHSS